MKKETYIMDCTRTELAQIINDALHQFDDFQQMAGDQGDEEMMAYFADSFDRLEAYRLDMSKADSERNQIRLVIKENYKMAMCMEVA